MRGWGTKVIARLLPAQRGPGLRMTDPQGALAIPIARAIDAAELPSR
jgi:hypothetical protein